MENDTTDGRSTLLTVRSTYSLSKRTAVYGQIGHMRNNDRANIALSGDQPVAALPFGMDQTGFIIGMRHTL